MTRTPTPEAHTRTDRSTAVGDGGLDRSGAPVPPPSTPGIELGQNVEVLNHFSRRWVPGFTVAESTESEAGEGAYRLRRTSDAAVLPAWFTAEEVRTRPR